MWPTVEAWPRGPSASSGPVPSTSRSAGRGVASILWTADEGDHRGLLPVPGDRAGGRGRVLRAAVAAAAGPRAGRVDRLRRRLDRPGRRRTRCRTASSTARATSSPPTVVTDVIEQDPARRLRRRPVRPRLDRLPDRPVVGLAGAERLHRHLLDHVRARRHARHHPHPGCCRSACTSSRCSSASSSSRWCWPARPCSASVLPDQVDFLNSLYWPVATLLSVVSLTSLYHISVPVRTPWRRDLPGALLAIAIWFLGSFVVRWIIGKCVGGASIYGPLATPIVLLIWLYVHLHRGAHRRRAQRGRRVGVAAPGVAEARGAGSRPRPDSSSRTPAWTPARSSCRRTGHREKSVGRGRRDRR